jgi:hypothetical protein
MSYPHLTDIGIEMELRLIKNEYERISKQRPRAAHKKAERERRLSVLWSRWSEVSRRSRVTVLEGD